MTDPTDPTDVDTSAPTWADALDGFAALLDRVERQLAEDAWSEAAAPTMPGQVPAGSPSAADRARGAALLARAAEQERRLVAERDATAVELGEIGRRRHAARRYGS